MTLLRCVLRFQVLHHFSENLFKDISLKEFMHACALGTQLLIEVKKYCTDKLFTVLNYVLLLNLILFSEVWNLFSYVVNVTVGSRAWGSTKGLSLVLLL